MKRYGGPLLAALVVVALAVVHNHTQHHSSRHKSSNRQALTATAFPTPDANAPCHYRGSGLLVNADRSKGCTPGMWVSNPRLKTWDDPHLTPAQNAAIRATYDPNTKRDHVCATPYNPRPSESITAKLKTEARVLYGEPASSSKDAEGDHYDPVNMGGATVITNFFYEQNYDVPQGPFFHNPKDKLEIKLYHLVCDSKTLTVQQARAIFNRRNWTGAFNQYFPNG